MFSDGASSFLFDRRNVRRDKYIGTWNRRWTLLRRWCLGTLSDVFGINMPISFHVEEVGYLRCLLHFVRIVDVQYENRGLGRCCFLDPIDGFNLVKDAEP